MQPVLMPQGPRLPQAPLSSQPPGEGAEAGSVACSEDAFLGGRLRLRQPLTGHRLGTDALLLAAASGADGAVADIGAGAGLVGLALALRGAERVVLVERDPSFAACAGHNIRAGGLGVASLASVDLFDRRAVLGSGLLADQSFDHVATNPPFDQALRGRRPPSPLKRAAHEMSGGGLGDWLAACTRLLRDGGTLTLIHRADALADVLAALPRRAGGLSIRPVHPRVEAPAHRILVSAVAGSRASLRMLPPLVLHGEDGSFTSDAARIHRGEAIVAMR
jgi:tRNA1(Val) A37 N6-methylase TrmN6